MIEKQPQTRLSRHAFAKAAASGPSQRHMMAGSVFIDRPCSAYSGNTTKSVVDMLRFALPTIATMRWVCASRSAGASKTAAHGDAGRSSLQLGTDEFASAISLSSWRWFVGHLSPPPPPPAARRPPPTADRRRRHDDAVADTRGLAPRPCSHAPPPTTSHLLPPEIEKFSKLLGLSDGGAVDGAPAVEVPPGAVRARIISSLVPPSHPPSRTDGEDGGWGMGAGASRELGGPPATGDTSSKLPGPHTALALGAAGEPTPTHHTHKYMHKKKQKKKKIARGAPSII
eukprot:scaffold6532_cov116-Isochrysis_galbana.AAC.6